MAVTTTNTKEQKVNNFTDGRLWINNKASNRNEYQEDSGGGGEERPTRKADNLAAISEPIF
jgi:hypothetical protein